MCRTLISLQFLLYKEEKIGYFQMCCLIETHFKMTPVYFYSKSKHKKKSLPGGKIVIWSFRPMPLTPLFIEILKNLEVVCKSKIITDPVSRAIVIQAIASSRSSWHSSTTTPNRKVLELPSILHKLFRDWRWAYKSSAAYLFMYTMQKEIFYSSEKQTWK